MANEKDESKNAIVTKSFSLALEIVSFSAVLRIDKHFDLASQLFRSGTSVGANVRESQGAESRADFIHKMKVAFQRIRGIGILVRSLSKFRSTTRSS